MMLGDAGQAPLAMQGDAGRWRAMWGFFFGFFGCGDFGWLKWGSYLGPYCWVHLCCLVPPSPTDHSSLPFMSARASASDAVLDLSVLLRDVCDSPGAEGIVPLLHTCVQPPHWCCVPPWLVWPSLSDSLEWMLQWEREVMGGILSCGINGRLWSRL
eukprot:EG_transcript_25777